jgi:hypothetical protein
MNPIRTIRRLACTLAGLAAGTFAFAAAAPAAFATPAPPDRGPAGVVVAPVIPTVAGGGLTPIRTTRAAIRRIRWLAVSLAAAVLTLLAGAPAALAVPLPPPGGATGAQVAPSPALPVAAGGTPGWQIVLIAIGSALIASALTLLALRVTRRPGPVQPSPS